MGDDTSRVSWKGLSTMMGEMMPQHSGMDATQDNQRAEVVLVVGVFDIFHAGHVRLLERAKALGSQLVVVINGDELTASYKRRPIINENDRKIVLESCRYVDHVVISNEYSIREIVISHGITKIVHGDDWEIESYKRQIRCDDDFLLAQNAQLVLVPYTAGISTSTLIERCASQAGSKTHGG